MRQRNGLYITFLTEFDNVYFDCNLEQANFKIKENQTKLCEMSMGIAWICAS